MPVQQDKIAAQDTGIGFEKFNNTAARRVLHNGVDYIKVNTNNTFTYYQTDGQEKISFAFEKDGVLDLNYDSTNDKYYTVRFNDELILAPTTSAVQVSGLADDFSEPAALFTFDTEKWVEPAGSSFLRSISNENLAYNTSQGQGRITSASGYPEDFEFFLDFNINSLAGTLDSFFGLHAVDSGNNLSYGVGVTHSGSDDLFYAVHVHSFENFSNGASLIDYTPRFDLSPSGTVDWIVKKTATSTWTITGTGATTTGVTLVSGTGNKYSVDDDTFPIYLQVQDVGTTVVNDFISFSSIFRLDTRAASSGTLNIKRIDDDYSSDNSLNFTLPSGIITTSFVAISGTNNTSINLTADDFASTQEVTTVLGSRVYPVLSVEEVDDEGTFVSTVVSGLDVINDTNLELEDFDIGSVGIAITPASIIYVTYSGNIYRFAASPTITGLANETTTTGIVKVSDIVPQTHYSLSYNDTNGGFISYVDYDDLVDQVRIKTFNNANPPTDSDRKLFLDITDWEEHADAGSPYQIFQHSADNNTQFYLQRHGTRRLNPNKVSSTTGAVTVTGSVFTDNSNNFITLDVVAGDLLIINETSYAKNGTYTITNVTANNLSVSGATTLNVGTSLDYTVVSNAELVEINSDVDISAFSSVNVDDFNLRAGTADTANITVEVINAWGDALEDKTVTFELISGDGVITPPSDTTNASGIATSQYQAGSVAGTVQIQVTVTDG